MRLSILVVSCNPSLLNGMLSSLANATRLDTSEIEILCSWNGDAAAEKNIQNTSAYEFLIAQRVPYHFASNMNSLAEKANGEILLFINDDIILDNDSIDQGINCLTNQSKSGIIGANLRDENNKISHCGMSFDNKYSPYHQLEGLISNEENRWDNIAKEVSASTGALFLIKKDNFNKLKFNQSYKICGEDVELCLDLREKLDLKIHVCKGFSGIHGVSKTRAEKNQYGNDSEDLIKMRSRRREFLNNTRKEVLMDELISSNKEIERLRSLINQKKDPQISEMKNEIDYWKKQSHTLHLTRIQQTEEIERLKKER